MWTYFLLLGVTVGTALGDGGSPSVDDIRAAVTEAVSSGSGEASGEAMASNITCPAAGVVEPRICDPGGEDNGVFLPAFGNTTVGGLTENYWSNVSSRTTLATCDMGPELLSLSCIVSSHASFLFLFPLLPFSPLFVAQLQLVFELTC